MKKTQMKKLKAIARVVLIVFVSAVLGLNIYAWNAQSLMGNALPMPMGVGAAVVLSGSMEPTLQVNDVIVVTAGDSYAPGDVVVYQSGSMLVVHRVLEVEEDTLITQGDANQVPDEPVALSAVKGKVVAVIPGMGVPVKVLKTPWATVVLVAGAVALMELSYRKDKKKGDDELERIKEEIRKLKDGEN